ncbi:MAG: MFS transporter, partial [SAR202 cluster bacterium]|nr:MFS transporter [SAR202 cluster bacterium]
MTLPAARIGQDGAPWWHGVTPYQWTVLALASLGWIFDVFEGQLYAVLKTPAVRAVLGPAASDQEVNGIAGLTISCFLAGGALGGVLFGALGDRWGRRRVMILTILLYSVFTALTALAQTWEQLAILRFLVALGVGGEWAVAAAVVAETFPERARTAASGLFHASSGLGVFLAALVARTIGQTDWRAAFWIGLAPALLTVWVRRSLKESDRWEARAGAAAGGSLQELWTDPTLRRRTLAAAGLAAVGLAGLWSAAFWAPELVREVARAQGVGEEAALRRMAGDAVLWMNMGNTAGLLCFAP